MNRHCPDCGLPTGGAAVCGSCGAFDTDGLTSWICFPCGRPNAHGAERCSCGRERTLECQACEGEVPFRAERCPHCGVPRFAFGATREAIRSMLEVQTLKERARNATLASATLAFLGVLLLITSQRPSSRVVGAGLLGLALAGGASAVTTSRSARRLVQ